MAYVPPNADELRHLIEKHWREHRDVSKRANADDGEFLRIKVQATLDRLRSLIGAGVDPHDAEVQALREVGFRD